MKLNLIVFVFFFGISCNALPPEDQLLELESVIQDQLEEYVALKSRIDSLEGKVVDLRAERAGEFTSQESLPQVENPADLDVQRRELSSNRAMEHVSKRQFDPPVAFHAYMSSNKCYGTGNRFIFDVVPLDVGHGYNDHSTYDVPVAGLYVLTWTVAVPQHHSKIITELVVNTATVGVLTSDSDYYTNPGTGSGVHPATGVVVIRLSQSDHVEINVKQTVGQCGDGNVIGGDSVARTTFSGWKL